MPHVTVTGRLADDPTLQYTDRTNLEFCTFDLIERRRWKDPDGKWHVDKNTHTVYVWHRYGRNCAESLHKGDRVIVTGQRKQVTVRDGGILQHKTVIDAKDVAVTLADGVLQLSKPARLSTAGNYGGTDPWAS